MSLSANSGVKCFGVLPDCSAAAMIDYIYPLCVAENYVDLVIRIAMLLSGLTDAALVITDVDTIWLCILRITDRGVLFAAH